MNYISEYFYQTRSAHIQLRTGGGYRIVCLDSYFETEHESYADSIKEADMIADRWVHEHFR
jgi:hypothetical protein